MSGIIWIIVVGFVAGMIARWLSPGPNKPAGFILTTVLGIAGAFLATFIGQTIGWYRADQGARLHRRDRSARSWCCSSGTGWWRAASSAILAIRKSSPISRARSHSFAIGTFGKLKEARHGTDGYPQRNAERPARPASAGAARAQSGGMSPIMMALLGLLAYKAMKGGGLGTCSARQRRPARRPHLHPARAPRWRRRARRHSRRHVRRWTGRRSRRSRRTQRRWPVAGGMLGGRPGGTRAGGWRPGGGLGGILGGLLGGAAAGTVLNGGLGQVLQDLQRSGQGRTAQSWVGTRPERGHRARRSRARARRRHHQRAQPADRHVARRAAAGPEPEPAGAGRSAHARRPAADRRRSAALVRPKTYF